MPNAIKSPKKTTKPIKASGHFTSPEEAALAKNTELVAQVEKIGLKIIKEKPKCS
jgi:hypothetical protein